MEKTEIVKRRLYETNASLVVMFENGEIKEFYSKRVNDIVSLLKENKDSLNGSVVADKVIGKVAASLLAVAGVKEIYANTISEFAIPVLEQSDIKYEYKNRTEYIINNDKTGMCPMENKFKDEVNLDIIYDYFVKNS